MPALLAVGPSRWFAIGPVAVQGSRIGLYGAYFTAGILLGAGGTARIRAVGEALARRWPFWLGIALLTGCAFVVVAGLRDRHAIPGPAAAALALTGTALAAFCASACAALSALALRFGGGRASAWDSLAANGFAIYLLHDPAVTWLQYGLLGTACPAPVKAGLVFVGALGASWAAAVLVRRFTLARRLR